MPQPGTADLPPGAHPRPPIVVLGRRPDHLFVAVTVDQAVDNALRLLLYGTEGAAHRRVEDLHFVDSAGQELRPTLESGQVDLVVNVEAGSEVTTRQEEVRDRIREIFRAVAPEVEQAKDQDPSVDDTILSLPDEALSFEELVGKLAAFFSTLRAERAVDEVKASASSFWCNICWCCR